MASVARQTGLASDFGLVLRDYMTLKNGLSSIYHVFGLQQHVVFCSHFIVNLVLNGDVKRF